MVTTHGRGGENNMMTSRTKSLIFGMALLSVIAFSIASTVAQGATEEAIGTNIATRHMNAGETKAFRFRQQTRLMFKTNVSLQLNMDVDALDIGDKSVTVELNCSAAEVVMNMTCRENQAELGLMNGSTVQTRTRNRVQVGGFAANISV
nr:hypothetical protein [Candidatus Sigynarchaeota archaeon]